MLKQQRELDAITAMLKDMLELRRWAYIMEYHGLVKNEICPKMLAKSFGIDLKKVVSATRAISDSIEKMDERISILKEELSEIEEKDNDAV